MSSRTVIFRLRMSSLKMICFCKRHRISGPRAETGVLAVTKSIASLRKPSFGLGQNGLDISLRNVPKTRAWLKDSDALPQCRKCPTLGASLSLANLLFRSALCRFFTMGKRWLLHGRRRSVHYLRHEHALGSLPSHGFIRYMRFPVVGKGWLGAYNCYESW